MFNCFNILDYITFEKEIKSNRIEYFIVYLTITSFVLKVIFLVTLSYLRLFPTDQQPQIQQNTLETFTSI